MSLSFGVIERSTGKGRDRRDIRLTGGKHASSGNIPAGEFSYPIPKQEESTGATPPHPGKIRDGEK